MNDENKAPSNDPDKSSRKETNSSGDVTSPEEASSSNTKETEEEPHSQAEAMTTSVEEELSEKVTQCKIDGIVYSILIISLSSYEVSCIRLCVMVCLGFIYEQKKL